MHVFEDIAILMFHYTPSTSVTTAVKLHYDTCKILTYKTQCNVHLECVGEALLIFFIFS